MNPSIVHRYPTVGPEKYSRKFMISSILKLPFHYKSSPPAFEKEITFLIHQHCLDKSPHFSLLSSFSSILRSEAVA